MADFPRGSEWRQWDLHIHSPFSFHWSDERPSPPTPAPVLDKYVDAIESSQVAVVAIVDYWTIAGYTTLRHHLRASGRSTETTILPGIELRVEAPTNFRLNVQVVFDDALSDERLVEFVAELAIRMPNGGSRSPSDDTFAEYGRTLDESKLNVHGFRVEERGDRDRMVLAAKQIARVTRESLESAVEKLGRNACVVVQPWSTSDGLGDLDWKKHSHEATLLLRFCDALECRDVESVDLCLNRQTEKNKHFIGQFQEALGWPHAPLCGSDAHQMANVGAFPNRRICWIKADPTFAGLKQALREPAARVFIGTEPPKLAHVRGNATKYVARISAQKITGSEYPEEWFHVDLPINPGLVAIIGNKGSGKSALADVVALATNAHCSDMAFLNPDRFCNPRERRAKEFATEVAWASGRTRRVGLDSTFDSTAPEGCRYLTQNHLEDLCNRLHGAGASAFEAELKKVIFSHATVDDRSQFRSLEEAIAFRTDGARAISSTHRARLAELHHEIAELETQITAEARATYENERLKRLEELKAHVAARPSPVRAPAPVAANEQTLTALKTLQADRAETEWRIAQMDNWLLEARRFSTAARRLADRFTALSEVVASTRQACSADVRALGLEWDAIVQVRIDSECIGERAEAARAAIDALEGARGVLRAKLASLVRQIAGVQDELDEPARRFEERETAQRAWVEKRDRLLGSASNRESLLGVKSVLRALDAEVPNRIARLRRERTRLVGEIFRVLKELRAAYERMYEPVQQFAREHPVAREELAIEFRVDIRATDFADTFLNYINQAKRGSFQGTDDGRRRVEQMISMADFETADGVGAFVDSVEAALRQDLNGIAIEPASQLRRGFDLQGLYDGSVRNFVDGRAVT